MKYLTVVLFLGVIISPMNFHLHIAAAIGEPTFEAEATNALAKGLIFFASFVVCADTFVRAIDGEKKHDKVLVVLTVILFTIISLITYGAKESIKGGSVDSFLPQFALFAASLVLSVASIALEPEKAN